MFDKLTNGLQKTFRGLTNKGIVTESNIAASLKEIKIALLEADVNYRVVNAFLKAVKERSLGQEVIKSLTPGQQFIKIVKDELTKLMGDAHQNIVQIPNELNVIMVTGLQGSGKTTTTAKLANYLKNNGHSVYLASTDIYRPAALEQLYDLANRIQAPYFPATTQMSPTEIAKKAQKEAIKNLSSFLLIDTAGRLHIDEELMDELEQIKKILKPHEIILVADAMTGQDAVNVAKSFHDKIGITSFILTKMDGDARGGAAISIRSITGAPIKFIGVGEKISEFEAFHPDRIASKILGMGDLTSLIEKAQKHFDYSQAKDLNLKIRQNEFTLTDFREQLHQIQKMGSITDILGMIPGMNNKLMQNNPTLDNKNIKRIDAIISSMTHKERENSNIINGSRKLRISKGSGCHVSEINRLLKQFLQTKKMMKKFSGMGSDKKSMRALQDMFKQGGF